MIAYRIPAEIGNRALQHCGSPRMDPNLGFGDTSVRGAAEVAFVYDKCRQAELKRNSWVFSIKETVLRAVDGNTMLLAPSLWSAVTSYFRGSIVADQAGNLWKSRTTGNVNNDPLLTSFWEPYFGPLTVSLYDSTVAYSAGEVVYTTAGDGTYRVYLSLISGNADVPATATAYDPTVTYFKGQVVTFASVPYMCLLDLNSNNQPDLQPAAYNPITSYAAAAKVAGSDGVIYQSIGSGNLGNDPTIDGGVHWTNANKMLLWTPTFTGGSGSLNWLEIGGAEFPGGVGLRRLDIQYPLGAGPATQSSSRNAFRLPAGHLRTGYQNPKGTTTWLGGPSGNAFSDWDFESGYLITADSGPIRLRFGADVTDVSLMDAMFCEGLAARCALEVGNTITQSDSMLATLAGVYKQFMNEARLSNAIEVGYEDPPDDDYLTVRY